MPKVQGFELPLDALHQVAASSGLQWVNSDAAKVAAVQASIAAEPQPVRVPRERPPAVVIDEAGAGMFTFVFAMGLVGADGQLGTADDSYLRAPGPLLSEPTAIRPLLGFDVHSPYTLLPRR